MVVSVFNNVTVTEKEIFDFIINPNNFDEEETHNEDGSVNKEGIVLCFEENVEFSLEDSYKIKNAYDGKWFIESNKVRIVAQNSEQITIEVLTGKSYIFTIVYKRDNEDDVIQEIEILSF